MKKLAFLMVLLFSASIVFAQVNKNKGKRIKKVPTVRIDDSKVPQAVKDAQTKKFQDISEIKWQMKTMRKEKQPVHHYIAHFKQNGMKVKVHYKEDGTAIVVITHIPIDKVPGNVTAKVSSNYPGFTLKLAIKVEALTKNAMVYRLTLIKPAAKLILYVDENGNDATKANAAQEAMGEDQSGDQTVDDEDDEDE